MKIKKGQKLFRVNEKNEIVEEIVEKTTKEHFFISGDFKNLPIDILTLEYSNSKDLFSLTLYRTKEEIIDKDKKLCLLNKLGQYFNPYNPEPYKTSLEDLIRIAKILKI